MKKCYTIDSNEKQISYQENILPIQDDLLTVLESYMDEMDTDAIFYQSLKFMIVSLYEFTENHKEALKLLKLAMDDGIMEAMTKRGH